MRRTPSRTSFAISFAAAAALFLAGPGGCRLRDTSPPAAASSTAAAAADSSRADSTAAAPARTTAIALPPGAWRVVANDGRVLVSVDTSAITAVPATGEARVRLLYAFDSPQVVQARPGVVYRTIVSQEQTDCAHATSHPLVAILYDEAAREVTRATTPAAGPTPPGLIGSVGPALCAYLRTRR